MEPKTPNKEQTPWSLLGFAWQLGYSLAIPIVFFVLVGRLLDKKFGTSPWLLIAGVILSLLSSTLTVYLKATKIMAETSDKPQETSDKKT